jgi:hypothetical protein
MEEAGEDGPFELEEAGELQALVARVLTSGGRDAAAVLPRYKQIVRAARAPRRPLRPHPRRWRPSLCLRPRLHQGDLAPAASRSRAAAPAPVRPSDRAAPVLPLPPRRRANAIASAPPRAHASPLPCAPHPACSSPSTRSSRSC